MQTRENNRLSGAKQVKLAFRSLLLSLLVLSIAWSASPSVLAETEAGPNIQDISLNLRDFPNGVIPRYEKLEITFQVDTSAENLQLPYDDAPPPGIQRGIGITVDALFSPDDWQTVYRQPAFYYQAFEDQVKNGKEWFYPTSRYVWKVRFAPNRPGSWSFKLVARDASGKRETKPEQFLVSDSRNGGFVRVSDRDARYFELENGSYFPGLGYNMNYDHISWENPILDNESNFKAMSRNGIQLVRMWLSQWGIYGPSWNPWNSMNVDHHSQYIPASFLTFEQAYPGSEVSMKISQEYNPCMFIGFMKPAPAVKQNATYRVRVRYKTTGLAGPRVAGQPFGLVAKTGGWLSGAGNNCQDPGQGTLVTPHQPKSISGWKVLEGSFMTGEREFLPNFFLTLENVTAGNAYIDYVWIEEVLGNGGYSPNIVSKPWMAHHLYMEQRNSYAFDKLVELSRKYGVYLKVVIQEKNDWIFNRIDERGNPIPNDPLCRDADSRNDPQRCPGNRWFYGSARQVTKVRWLQQAWWRYIQARWGYSTSIHSWELLNEGDPGSEAHYQVADEFGAYMRQFKPNHHLVTTSFWHSFPRDNFWASAQYPNVDYADYHLYVDESDLTFNNTAMSTFEVSMEFGARQPGGAGKPVMRGETGLGGPTEQFAQDTQGIWLHNFIWGGINPGGLIESYWYENVHIYKQNKDGSFAFDHRPHFRAYYNFISQIPLNNGKYRAAEAQVSNDSLRAWGQVDRMNGRAHLWIFNKNYTWKKVVNGESIPAVSGKVTLPGFRPAGSYTVQWWDPYQPDPAKQIIRTQTVLAKADGSIRLGVDQLKSDIAIQIRGPRAVVFPYTVNLPLCP